jgi:hypothetical protein
MTDPSKLKDQLNKISKEIRLPIIVSQKNEDAIEELLVWLDSYQEGLSYDLPEGLLMTDGNVKAVVDIEAVNDYKFDEILSQPGSVTEDFIGKISTKLDKKRWATISLCQNLSAEFLEVFKDKINKVHLRYNALIHQNIKNVILSDRLIVTRFDNEEVPVEPVTLPTPNTPTNSTSIGNRFLNYNRIPFI